MQKSSDVTKSPVQYTPLSEGGGGSYDGGEFFPNYCFLNKKWSD